MKYEPFQKGSLRKRKRAHGPAVWEFRYRLTADNGHRKMRSVIVGTTAEYPTRRDARAKIRDFVLAINTRPAETAPSTPSAPAEHAMLAMPPDTSFNALADRFAAEEHLSEIMAGAGYPNGLRYSTAKWYFWIMKKHLRPRWGAVALRDIRAGGVQQWLATLPASAKYKGSIKGLLHRLFEKAMLWEILDYQRNPMDLVEVRGASRRSRIPRVLTPEEFQNVLALLPEPQRTLAFVALCTGLRISELLALQWPDFDFDARSFKVARAIVDGHLAGTKTESSADALPLSPELAKVLYDWRQTCPATPEGWVFPNPKTLKPYYSSSVGGYAFDKIARMLGIRIGWHTFRHTYRSWLDATGAPIGVQQKLMRHAQVSTTMNIYGNALMNSKREANSKVVGMVLEAGKIS